MKKILCFAFCVGLVSTFLLLGQEILNNGSIAKLVQSGLGDDLIVQMIKTQPGRYDTSADEILALKKAGVSDKVLAALIAKNVPAATAVSKETAVTDEPDVKEIGIYFKKDNVWTELLPEVVNWKTGGTWKNIGSVGIIKKDVNGNIPGARSLTTVKSPFEFLIYAPEGVTYTEYQLLKLRANSKGYREFRTITGGVFNQSSGAQRDMLTFEAKKVAPRKFIIVLPSSFGSGEYGFIHMGAAGSSGNMTSMSMGKMYTFHISE